MIISPQQWHILWEAVKDDFPQSTEKGVAVIFSLQEVETVCAVKMLLVRLTCNCCGVPHACSYVCAESSTPSCIQKQWQANTLKN